MDRFKGKITHCIRKSKSVQRVLFNTASGSINEYLSNLRFIVKGFHGLRGFGLSPYKDYSYNPKIYDWLLKLGRRHFDRTNFEYLRLDLTQGDCNQSNNEPNFWRCISQFENLKHLRLYASYYKRFDDIEMMPVIRLMKKLESLDYATAVPSSQSVKKDYEDKFIPFVKEVLLLSNLKKVTLKNDYLIMNSLDYVDDFIGEVFSDLDFETEYVLAQLKRKGGVITFTHSNKKECESVQNDSNFIYFFSRKAVDRRETVIILDQDMITGEFFYRFYEQEYYNVFGLF
jgi:hypothetical protein